MYNTRKRNNIIIISLLVIVFIMAGAYSAFSSQLNIKGSSKVTSNWDIEITNITDGVSTGTAENASSPSYTALTASMEANLYEAGDSMEYDVTISNKGTLDAKLDDITTNLSNENSDAVIITFSGYTKGEKLLVGESKVIKVKIEYNSNYTGDETSSEVEINFDYVQNNNETEPSSNTYLLTYDCTTNGGKSCANNNEYLVSNSNVDLSKKGNKDKYIFVGWNINKDATSGLESYTMPESDSTLYAIFKEENISLTISTTNTTNSITIISNALLESGISKYEYSKDNGSTWVTSDSNTYTFKNLTLDTSYNVQVKVTSKLGNVITSSKTVTTSSITKPTFSETQSSGKNTITITYPSECGSAYTCTYQRDSDTEVTVTSTTTLTTTTSGTVVAKVSDGTNTVSSSYSTVIKYNITTSKNSTVGITVTPSTTFASVGTNVTFTVPSKSGYTYQGSQIKNSSGTVVQTLNASTESFTMPSYEVTIAPIYKYDDKTILNSNNGTRDTTFSLTRYDISKPLFGWENNSFYAIQAIKESGSTERFTTRAEVISAKTYQVNQYCKMTFEFNGSVWVVSSTSRGKVVNIGLVRSANVWIESPTGVEVSSPDYIKSSSFLPIETTPIQTLELTLTPSQSLTNKYYIVIQYLSYNAATSLNFTGLYFTGCTYYS